MFGLQDVVKGQQLVYVTDSTVFSPGQWVRLMMTNPTAGGLVSDMNAGLMAENADCP